MQNNNIVVFGAAGFLGSAIKNLFLKEKHNNVLVPDRSEVNLLELNQTSNFVNAQPANTLFVNCAATVGSVHSGLERELELIDVNTRLNLNLYSALRKFIHPFKLINFLSNCIYPHKIEVQSEDLLYEGEPHHTARAFAHSKRHAMQMFEILNTNENSKVQQLILPGLFGAGNHLDENRLHAFDAIIVRMLKAHRQGLTQFEVYGSGAPVREWVPVSAVAAVTEMIHKSTKSVPTILNFSVGFNESIWDTTLRIQKLIGYKGEIVRNEAYVDGAPVKILRNNLFQKSYPKHSLDVDIDFEIVKSIKFFKKFL
jgi:GDP-L-fucose synthase